MATKLPSIARPYKGPRVPRVRPRNHTVTSNLSDEEYDAFTKLCLAQGLSEDSLLRQAFRVYHDHTMRLHQGEEQRWFDKDGNQVWPAQFNISPPDL